MPFPQIAKDNLAATLSLANLFTDELGRYASLEEQIDALPKLQQYIGWQIHHPYHRAVAGRNIIKQSLSLYLAIESSVDMFMRYINLPSCQIQNNLAYLDDNIQKLIYQHFKENILRKALYYPRVTNLTTVELEVQKLIQEKILGYAKKMPGQSGNEWQIFVAEINVGIEVLSKQYKDILLSYHAQFYEFRKEQLGFTLNYFDRYLFLAKLEDWLRDIPKFRSAQSSSDAQVNNFCQQLLALEQSYNAISLENIYTQFTEMRQRSLNQEQYKTIVELLIRLKPKYDAYRSGEENLNPEAQLQKFMDYWPKPTFSIVVSPASRREAADNWEQLRARHRTKQEQELSYTHLKSKH